MDDPINDAWHETMSALHAMKKSDELLAATRKSIDELAVCAKREAEERQQQLIAAEKSIRAARQSISSSAGNAAAISALADSIESLSAAIKTFK